MKHLPLLLGAALACCASSAPAAPPAWRFEYSGGVPDKLVWQTELGPSYYLFESPDLRDWTLVPTFPQPGTGGEMQHSFTPGPRGFFRIIPAAPAPEGMALIPAGGFLMGENGVFPNEEPVHSVTVSGFYLAQHEVTKALWDEVAAWAAVNGYDISPEGATGKAGNHPAHHLTWYECVKWCNARSQKEGLTPCYTVAGQIYKTGDHPDLVCNWSANGYRLPTEAEWEKAARGGLERKRFPWGDTITHSEANYVSWEAYGEYDVSPTRGHHPTYYVVDENPWSSPVGSFAPNGYGLYDMAGNQWEYCWDWYEDGYSSAAQTDPRGPAASSWDQRVVRSGSWGSQAPNCRVANRSSEPPQNGDYFDSTGFRPARSSVP